MQLGRFKWASNLKGKKPPPIDPTDKRGAEPTRAEKRAIEKQYGLKRGCGLMMNGDKYFYIEVGTWGEEAGEKPCLWAWRYYAKGTTVDTKSLLNVWTVI